VSVNRTKWEGRFYVPKPTSVRERIQLEYFTAKMSDGMLEDLSNIESTQRGMMSGAKPFLILQDGELLIRHSLEQVVKWTSSTTAIQALHGDSVAGNKPTNALESLRVREQVLSAAKGSAV
jgi:hypothetical protein